jgi:chorismate mutase
MQNGTLRHATDHPRSLLACRGVRGATTVPGNDRQAVLEATRELLYIMIRANGIHPDDVASAIFTTTQDIDVTYPALAARQLGWYDVALLCGHEMNVPNSINRCIRILIHWNTTSTPQEIVHVYLREAQALRPDRNSLPPIPIEEVEAAVKHFDLSALNKDLPIPMTLAEPAQLTQEGT